MYGIRPASPTLIKKFEFTTGKDAKGESLWHDCRSIIVICTPLFLFLLDGIYIQPSVLLFAKETTQQHKTRKFIEMRPKRAKLWQFECSQETTDEQSHLIPATSEPAS